MAETLAEQGTSLLTVMEDSLTPKAMVDTLAAGGGNTQPQQDPWSVERNGGGPNGSGGGGPIGTGGGGASGRARSLGLLMLYLALSKAWRG